MKKTFSEEQLKKMDEIFKATPGTKIVVPERKNTENIFYGIGFYVCKREGKFWFSYSSAYHGGFSIIHEITEEEYIKVRNGHISSSVLHEAYPEKSGDIERSAKIEARWEKLGE